MAKQDRKRINRAIALVASVVLAVGLVPVPAIAVGTGDELGGLASEASPAAATPDAVPLTQGDEGTASDEQPAKSERADDNGSETGAVASGNGKDDSGADSADSDGAAAADSDGDEVSAKSASSDKDKDKNEGKDAKSESPAFAQSATADGVTVTVEADAGAFPEGARLSVESAPPSATEAAVAPERDADANVAASYTFDVKVLGADGAELQPAGGKSVRVSFKAAEVADPNLDVSVYHVPEGTSGAEELGVDVSGATATTESGGFSYYTVEFTYGELQYVLKGGEKVALADVLAAVGLTGEATGVEVSDPALFSASNETGEWVVTSHKAFSTDEWMRVAIAGKAYKIEVTDDQTASIDYVGEDGTIKTAPDCKIITSSTGRLDGSWYALTEDVTHNGGITISGEVNLILCDGKTWEIEELKVFSGAASLKIWCQSGGSGAISTVKSLQLDDGGTLIINGGVISCSGATAVSVDDVYGHDPCASFTMNGGWITGEKYGVYVSGRGCSATIYAGTIIGGAYACFAGDDGRVGFGASGTGWTNTAGTEGKRTVHELDDVTARSPFIKKLRIPEGVIYETVSASPTAGGTVSGGGAYRVGDTATLVATPYGDNRFVNWTENDVEVSTDAEYSFTVENDRMLVANFTIVNPVTVVNGTTEDSPAAEGSMVSITANDPQPGMFFYCWESADGVTFANQTATTTTFGMPAKAVSVSAIFKKVIIENIGSQTYTGSRIEPDLRVFLEGVDVWLEDGVGYTVDYTDNVNAGTATAIVMLKDPWVGSGSATFNIIQADLSSATVTVADQVYDGTAQKPVPTVTWNGKQVAQDDYTAAYANNVRAGTATVTVTGKRNFTETSKASGTFKIAERPVTVTADSAERVYDGSALTADGFTSEGLAQGDRVASAKVEGSQTDVGSSANKVSGAKIVNAAGEDVTDCYDITYKDGTLTVKPGEKGSYEAASGSGSTWTKGSTDPVTLTFKRATDDERTFDLFEGVEVDGKAVPEKDASGKANWTAKKGSLILSLQPSFLETLSTGKHTVTAVFDDGSASTTFTVEAKASPTPASGTTKGTSTSASPKTGDETGGTVVVLSVTAGTALCLALFALSQRKRRKPAHAGKHARR